MSIIAVAVISFILGAVSMIILGMAATAFAVASGLGW